MSESTNRIAEIISALREAAAGNAGPFAVAAALRPRVVGPDDPLVPVIWALEYDFVERDEADRRGLWGPWAPWFEGNGTTHPPPLASIPDEQIEVWSRIAGEVDDIPLLASRLHDLLWVRRWNARPDLDARAAFDQYLASVDRLDERLERAFVLARAVELAGLIGDADRQRRASPIIQQEAWRSLTVGESEPGVALRLIETLLTLPPDMQPGEIGALLESARTTYANDPFITQTVIDLIARRADPVEHDALHNEQVNAWRAKAGQATGLTRLTFLRRAQELATTYDLRTSAAEIGREIQSLGEDELDLKRVAHSVSISENEADAYVEAYIGADWQETLTRVGGIGPPSGDHQKNVESVIESMQRTPLQFLISRTVLGPYNMPIREIASDEEHREHALVNQEAMSIGISGIFIADAIDRLRHRFGAVSKDDLATFFESPLIGGEVAERFAHGLELFWEGKFDDAAHVLLPRIEAVVRNLALALNIVVVRPPRGPAVGGVRLLGDLIGALSGRIDESWRRYLRNALTEPTGLNLRNSLLHALVPSASRTDAAVLIQIACYLRLLRTAPVKDSPEVPDPGASESEERDGS